MSFNFEDWIGQVTTGHGAMILGPTLLAAATGTMPLPTAIPLLAAGVVGLLWPENTALKTTAQTAVGDVEALIAAYHIGLDHGANDAAPAAASSVSSPPAPVNASAPAETGTHTGTAVSAIAMLLAAGIGLSACANQTPAQQSATVATVASGLLCLADASGKIVATASTNDPNAVKAVNAAVTAGNVLLTDTACQTAMASGAAALSSASPAQP